MSGAQGFTQLKLFHEYMTQYKNDKLFRLWLGPIPFVFVFHPETVGAVLKSNHPKGMFYDMLHPWLGQGLLTSHGPQWKRNRMIISSAFHFEMLKSFMSIYVSQSQIFCRKLSDAISDVIGEAAMGLSFHAQDEVLQAKQHVSNESHDGRDLARAMSWKSEPATTTTTGGVSTFNYVQAVYDASEFTYSRFFLPIFQNDFMYRYFHRNGSKLFNAVDRLHKVSNHVIHRRMTEMESGNPEMERKVDFLQILLDWRAPTTSELSTSGSSLTHTKAGYVGEGVDRLSFAEIRQEVDTFLFEGHDTTSAGIAWTLYLLARHPEEQQKCVEEIQTLLFDKEGEIHYPDVFDALTYDNLKRLTFLEACIKESLRLFPPVPQIGRTVAEKPLKLTDKVTLPVGTQVAVLTYLLHRNPDVFDSPNSFMPERFLSEDKMDHFAFVGFSAGPRNCIGQNFAMLEEKVALSCLLSKFCFGVGPGVSLGTDDPYNPDVLPLPELILRPMNGMNLTVTRRC